MKRKSLYKIAFKTWRRFGIGLFIMLVVASCCFMLASARLSNMISEKQEPYELMAMSEKITDANLTELTKTPDILSVTPVLDVAATIQIGENSLEVPIQGIDKDYLQFPFLYGNKSESLSLMPYLVINRTAADTLLKNQTDVTMDMLLSQQVLLNLNEKQIVGALSGIFEDESEEPKVYMDLTSAKNLMMQQKLPTVYSLVYVRCLNAGKTETVTEALSNMGLEVLNANTELEIKWETQTIEVSYLYLSASIAILASVFLTCERKRRDTLFHGSNELILQSIGFTEKENQRLNRLRQFIFVMFSIAIGLIIFFAINSGSNIPPTL